MKRNPRSLFRSRQHGPVYYVPGKVEDVPASPVARKRVLMKGHEQEIDAAPAREELAGHDDWCQVVNYMPCNCRARVRLTPEHNHR